MNKILFLLVGVFSIAQAGLAQEPARNWKTLDEGFTSSIRKPRSEVVTSRERWAALWKEHTRDNPAPMPKIDFTRERVVAIFMGQRFQGGYSVQVRIIRDKDDPGRLIVQWAERKPQHAANIMMMTQPFKFIRVPDPEQRLRIRIQQMEKIMKEMDARHKKHMADMSKRMEELQRRFGLPGMSSIFQGF